MHLLAIISCIAVLASYFIHVKYPNFYSILSMGFWMGQSSFKETWQAGDGRELKSLEYVKKHAVRGNAVSVLNAIDEFGWKEYWLMNIGDAKGNILRNEVKTKNPKYALEVGAFVGYSGVLIASLLSNDSRLISVEFSPANAKIARDTIDFAGLSEKAIVIDGTVTTTLKQYMAINHIPSFDLIFLDHHKDSYLSDLLYLLDQNMLSNECVVVADNVLVPGAPQYREFVNTDKRFETIEHVSHLEYMSAVKDIVTVSILRL